MYIKRTRDLCSEDAWQTYEDVAYNVWLSFPPNVAHLHWLHLFPQCDSSNQVTQYIVGELMHISRLWTSQYSSTLPLTHLTCRHFDIVVLVALASNLAVFEMAVTGRWVRCAWASASSVWGRPADGAITIFYALIARLGAGAPVVPIVNNTIARPVTVLIFNGVVTAIGGAVPWQAETDIVLSTKRKIKILVQEPNSYLEDVANYKYVMMIKNLPPPSCSFRPPTQLKMTCCHLASASSFQFIN